MNPLLLIVLFTLGAYALKGANASTVVNRSTIKLISIDSLQIIGAEFILSATVAIDNPTNINLNIQKPYLTLYFNGSPLANSIPTNAKVLIKANDRTTIRDLNLRMPFTSVPAIALAVFDKKETNKEIVLETATIISGFAVKDEQHYPIANLVKLIKK